MAQPIGATAAHTTSSMLFEGLFFNVAEVAIAHKNVLKMTVIPIKKLIKSGYKLDIKYKCLQPFSFIATHWKPNNFNTLFFLTSGNWNLKPSKITWFSNIYIYMKFVLKIDGISPVL